MWLFFFSLVIIVGLVANLYTLATVHRILVERQIMRELFVGKAFEPKPQDNSIIDAHFSLN
jgi:hypothetical protein